MTGRLPLLEDARGDQAVGILAVTGDRGLAGPFNAQVLRRAFSHSSASFRRASGACWLAVGKKGRSTLIVPALRARSGLDRVHRPAGILRRRSDREPCRRAVRRGRRRQGRHGLQPVHLAADAGGRDRRSAADPAHGRWRRTRRSPPTTSRSRVTRSTSPNRRRSSRGCSRPTSRRRSTARFSSRQRPSSVLA